MEKYLHILEKCKLFDNIEKQNILSLLDCLEYKIHSYAKDQRVISSGEQFRYIGILLSGVLNIIKEDFNGNVNIVSKIEETTLFGESFVFANITSSPVTISSVTDSTIMFLSPENLLSSCSSACTFHTQLISNALKIIASKNIELNYKIELLSQKTIRDKIMFYLETESEKNKRSSFSIPYNRNELANFLGIDRSALSRELSNMQKDGKINYNRNHFILL